MKSQTKMVRSMGRREFVGGVVFGSVALGITPAFASIFGNEVSVAGIHNHVVSPDDVKKDGVRSGWTGWSAERVIAQHGEASNVRSLLSYSVPYSENIEQARALTRLCNDYAAQIARANRGQFVMLASLPDLSDQEGALGEIARVYAYDRAVIGVTVMTSYGDRWLNDPAFIPVWNELDRRRALVFVQPSIAAFGPATPVVADSYAARKLDAAGTVTRLQGRWRRVRFSNSSPESSGSGIPIHTYWWGMLPWRTRTEAATLNLNSNVTA
jgi:hypothetical protein